MNSKKKPEKKEHVFHKQTVKALRSSNTTINASVFPFTSQYYEVPTLQSQWRDAWRKWAASPLRWLLAVQVTLAPDLLVCLSLVFQLKQFSGWAEMKAGVWGGHWNNDGMYLVFSLHVSRTVSHYLMICSSGDLSRSDATEDSEMK